MKLVRSTLVDQTILASDPKRLGNCVSACVATYLGLPIERVPHFLEHDPDVTVDGSAPSTIWWWLLVGFMASRGLWPVELDSLGDGDPGELLFVAGPTVRGVHHQVLYRDLELWHDPHPSKTGLTGITEVLAWRPRLHDHTPTDPDSALSSSNGALEPAADASPLRLTRGIAAPPTHHSTRERIQA